MVVGLFVVPAAPGSSEDARHGRRAIRALAWVDTRILTDLDLDRWLGRPATPPPGGGRPSEAQIQGLVDLAVTHLESREARQRGVEVTPAMINRAMAARIRAVGGPDRFRALLRRSLATAADIRKDCEDRLLVRRLYVNNLPGASVGRTPAYGRIGPAEVRELYRTRREEFRLPGRAHVALIEIRDPDVERGEALAKEAVKSLRSGADFAGFARARSKGPRADQGGDLGWIEKGRLDPSIDAFAFSAEEGAISDPVLSPGGAWWIVRLISREPGRLRSFEEVQQEIADQIRARKIVSLRRRTLRRLILRAGIHPDWLRDRMLEAAASIGEPSRY